MRSSAAWESFRDTTLMAGLGLAVFCLQRLWQQEPLEIPTGRTVLTAGAIFALSWLATLVACWLGGTTSSDDMKPGHLPTSLIVAFLTGFVAFIVFLLAGLLE